VCNHTLKREYTKKLENTYASTRTIRLELSSKYMIGPIPLFLVFVLAVIALSFATARFPRDSQTPGAEQGSMAWHRQAEQQHRQERYFQELQERTIQRFEEPQRLNDN